MILEITEGERDFLLACLLHVSGDPVTSRRKYARSLLSRLYVLGGDVLLKDIGEDSHIYFKESK